MLRPLAALAPLLLFAACAGEPSSPVMQNDRMSARLAPEITAGTVSVQPQPAGTQVAIPDQSLFSPGSGLLNDHGRMVLTYVVQALLEPTLLTIGVGDASDGPQGARTASVADYIHEHAPGAQIAPVMVPGAVPVGAVGTPVPGTTITVSVAGG
jgi:hypothetical protein